MHLNWSPLQRTPKHYRSIEEAEAERNPAKVRDLSIKEVEIESVRGRLRQFSRLESLRFCWCPDYKRCFRRETDVTFSPALRAEILELRNLRSFTILNTPVREIPIWLAPLPKLETLCVRGTEIREVPAEIKLFSRLRQLQLANSDLFAVPDEIGELKQLRSLALTETFISEIPLPILQLPRLRGLLLAGTIFTHEGVARVKAHFPNAAVGPATAARLSQSQSHLDLRREANENP